MATSGKISVVDLV